MMRPMENRGYTFGFLVALVVVAGGLYLAFTALSGMLRQPGPVAGATVAASPTAEIAPTLPATQAPGATDTPFVVPTPIIPTSTPVPPTSTPRPRATRPPASPTPVAPPPTPVPTLPSFPFRSLGVQPEAVDSGCGLLYGYVQDAAGQRLEGVRVKAYNEWLEIPPSPSKGGVDLGKYDLILGEQPVTWYIVVVDVAGNPLSGQAILTWNRDEACRYRLDWQRTY
jgi:hypothetical protein